MARTFIEKIAQKMRIIPDLDRAHSSGSTDELRKYPNPDDWHDHVELDAQEWPKIVEKRYSLVPTTCFNCESACGMLAYVDKDSGEVALEAYEQITGEKLVGLQAAKIKKIKILAIPEGNDPGVMENTLKKDPSTDEEDALTRIYNLLRPGDPPNIETARGLLDRLFFNSKRYNLG